MFPSMTFAEPGAHGAGITGTQGIGVNTPSAAAVAAATVGLAIELHMPKGGMFTIGLLSMMLAADVPHMHLFAGRTFNVLGASPKLHIIIAPVVTSCGMAIPFSIHAARLRTRPLPWVLSDHPANQASSGPSANCRCPRPPTRRC